MDHSANSSLLLVEDLRTLTFIIGDNFPELSLILFIIDIYILLALDRLHGMGGVVLEGESLRPYYLLYREEYGIL